MLKYVSVAEMRAVEQEADRLGLSYAQMMEHAGTNLGKLVDAELGPQTNRSALGLIGSGNNGGDTLVSLAYLAENGWKTVAYFVKERNVADPLVQRLIANGGIVVSNLEDEDLQKLHVALNQSEVVLDGVLGTGFQLPLKESIGKVLKSVKEIIRGKESPTYVVAVDCPSGVDCDSGQAADEVIPADLTVTMAAIKGGLLKFPAYPLCGRILIADIGLNESFPIWNQIKRYVIDADWVKTLLPKRSDNSHKGTFGTTFILAGCENFTGAAYLAGKAAYLAGCGLVTVGSVRSVYHSLAGEIPEATWLVLPDQEGYLSEKSLADILNRFDTVDAFLFGPGFGLHSSTSTLVAQLLESGGDVLTRCVVDADGLKLLAQHKDWQSKLPRHTILTPHPGEMSVLTGMSTKEIQSERVQIAERFASQWGHVVVLKGAFTVIADPDGCTAVNPIATSALAKAGSGDVLAGLIAGLLAQGLGAFEAAVIGVWVHAQAGLMAAKRVKTTRCVLASDVIKAIPQVFDELER